MCDAYAVQHTCDDYEVQHMCHDVCNGAQGYVMVIIDISIYRLYTGYIGYH